jgi:uncharacterized phage-associated protein
MLKADDVAQYFCLKHLQAEQVEGIHSVALQKLLYYAQGYYSAIYNEPLFAEELKAWDHGPVVPAVWNRYKHQPQVRPTVDRDAFDDWPEEKTAFLDQVFQSYGQFNSFKLESMSHTEQPWLTHYKKDSNTISVESLAHYFEDYVTPTSDSPIGYDFVIPEIKQVDIAGRRLYLRVYDGEQGGFVADLPECPGCMSQGRTKAEARKNVLLAYEDWVRAETIA